MCGEVPDWLGLAMTIYMLVLAHPLSRNQAGAARYEVGFPLCDKSRVGHARSLMKADKDKLRKVGQCARAKSCAIMGFCVQAGAVGQASCRVGPSPPPRATSSFPSLMCGEVRDW